MKKITFCLMAFAVALATMFTSCGKDDDDNNDDDNKISTLSASCKGESFSTSLAAFYSSTSGSTNTGTNKLSDIFGSSTAGSTTIAGTAKVGTSQRQLAINIKGVTSGTYELSVATDNAINNALIDLLSGKTVKETISDAASNVIKTDAMIIYRTPGEAEGGATYYFSTKAKVTFNLLAIYADGNFSATMRNAKGDTFEITDGKFKVFGKPAVSGSK